MMFAVVTIVHTADSKKLLNNDTEEILTTARKYLCQMTTLRYQQLEGLQTAVSFGVRKIDAFRTLITESLTVFMLFSVQEVYDKYGIYYDQNVISNNMMIADIRKLLNGNSFTAKNEITNLMRSTYADIIVIDLERKYTLLVRILGESVIEISVTSSNHINAMDMNKDYGRLTLLSKSHSSCSRFASR